MADGTFWNNLSKLEKVRFIAGYVHGYRQGLDDAVAAAEGKLPNNKTDLEHLKFFFNADRITFGDLMDGVDRCYADFRNRRLDVTDCVDWTIMGINGDSDKIRDSFLLIERQAVAGQ